MGEKINMASVTEDTADLLQRMLRRLPGSLWNTDPDSPTLQRELYHAFALQMAAWLEQREIVRTMTLLLEAQGVDLDVLLADYGLRRYLQRPDPYARQIGMNILWTPKGTLYSLARLADLLFDLPHVTMRTGRSQEHIFVAATHAVTTPYSYWGLVSDEGIWYAVTVDGEVPTISQRPPPGLDLSPGPHTLRWFTVQDELGATWYVSLHGDTLQITTTPPQGYGTSEPFAVLDGQGQRWLLAVRSTDQCLVSVLDTGLPGFSAWRLRDETGAVFSLWIEANVPTTGASAPGGSTDQTPGGAAVDWFAVPDEIGTRWYVTLAHDVLFTQLTVPGGTGTTAEAAFLDVTGQRWVLTAHSGTAALITTAFTPLTADYVVVAPASSFQAFQLLDSDAVPWWVSIDADTLFVTPLLPFGATDVTPVGGPFRWLRVYDAAGGRWYASPSTMGVLVLDTVTPGGRGTALPQQLGDRHAVLWHLSVDAAGNLATSDAVPIDYAGMATALCLTDERGARWFWRVHGDVLEWSSVLWPDTLDQSPWGDLGWLQLENEEGHLRHVYPTPLGDPTCSLAPPLTSPWGWRAPVTFRDLAGALWHLTALADDRIGLETGVVPDALHLPAPTLPLREALEAFSHIQAAGSNLTLLVT
jgi:hypothetical protein